MNYKNSTNQKLLSKKDWEKLDELLDFIYLNTDKCCQDLSEGQECKFKVDEIKNILSFIRPNV
tara:strand:- start:697 stop:885 length:189 start_codon:yes stop_codon:yes gene_type:complete